MPEDDPLVNRQINQYLIVRRLGQGGMGAVYLARHTTLERDVALKFLASQLSNDVNYVERFLREARAAARLNHPNIVAVHDAGTNGELYYIAFEYVEGRDLAQLLQERKRLSESEAAQYGRQAASALGTAHAAGIVHRDVKPSNLIVSTKGDLKIADLGLAKQLNQDAGDLTLSGVVMGTPYYISPEQIHGSKDVDGRCDIYSLGATLYHLVTGELPFRGTSSAVVMAMHLSEPIPWPQTVNPDLSDGFCQVLYKMMAKEPAERFQTMEEVERVLEQLGQGHPEAAVPANQVSASGIMSESPPPKKGISLLSPGAASARGSPDRGRDPLRHGVGPRGPLPPIIPLSPAKFGKRSRLKIAVMTAAGIFFLFFLLAMMDGIKKKRQASGSVNANANAKFPTSENAPGERVKPPSEKPSSDGQETAKPPELVPTPVKTPPISEKEENNLQTVFKTDFESDTPRKAAAQMELFATPSERKPEWTKPARDATSVQAPDGTLCAAEVLETPGAYDGSHVLRMAINPLRPAQDLSGAQARDKLPEKVSKLRGCCGILLRFQAEENVRYILTFQARSVNGALHAYVRGGLWGVPEIMSMKEMDVTTTWQKFEVEYTPPRSDGARFAIVLEDPGELWLDAIKIEREKK